MQNKIYNLFKEAKQIRDEYLPLWQTIAKYTGITLDIKPLGEDIFDSSTKRQLDEFVDDPTAMISCNQSADYLLGLIWGNGKNVFRLRPSRYVLELAESAEVNSFYDFATQELEFQVNHSESGLFNSLRPFFYDQTSIGTSAIGCYLNKEFGEGNAENALVFRNYGVDGMAILEGVNGSVDYVFVSYNWKANRIVAELCYKNGELQKDIFDRLPKQIKQAFEKNDFKKNHKLVFGFYPREDFNPRLQGARGYKYKGCWFLDDANENTPFLEEDFKQRPIVVSRMIKLRNEIYGRSPNSMTISSIRLLNFLMSSVVESIEKQNRPALGVFSDALFGDKVIDTSAGEMVPLNSNFNGKGTPLFPIYDVGDISGIVNILLPYYNEKIATASKVDVLLDFSSAKEMTATESMQRYAIRGKSLAGFLLQQKESQIQILQRAISLLDNVNLLGIDSRVFEERAAVLKKRGLIERLIPNEVMQIKEKGLPWYEIELNNELDKLTNTEAIQDLLSQIQAVMAIGQIKPEIVMGVDTAKALQVIKERFTSNQPILYSEDEFKSKLKEQVQMQQAQVALQAGQVGATIEKDISQANKNNKEAINATRK